MVAKKHATIPSQRADFYLACGQERHKKNDGLQKQYAHIMKQNNWFRMMGISNAFSLSAALYWSHRIYFGRLFQSCSVFMWRKEILYIPKDEARNSTGSCERKFHREK